MDGFVNIYTSRRSFHLKCSWYKAINNNEKLVFNEKPNGYFYAKMVNAITNGKSNIGGFLQINNSLFTLMTVDNVYDLKSNDKILLNGKEYRVVDVQRQMLKKQSEFVVEPDYYTYISIRA